MGFVGMRHPRGQGGAAMVWRGQLRLWGDHAVELNLHLAWLLTLGVITWLLAVALLPRLFPTWLPIVCWGVAVSVAITDGAAGLIHELGHAWAAVGKGRRVYRITLYGLAASVYRSSGQLRPRDQAAIAAAGPLSHLLIGTLLWTTWQFLPADNEALRFATGFPAVSQLAVGVLNLLPVQPLDGGRVARALIAAVVRV
jgi:Zn-dependent protease